MGGRKLLERSFLPPHTPYFSRIFKLGLYLKVDTVRSMVERTMFALHPRMKVLVKLFQKLAGS